jgi:uncharacterized membrane protein
MATVASYAHVGRTAAAARTRLDSVDLLRGIVMVIMVIDHTRDFVHGPALHYDATDLTRTSAAIFMTRWITHFCAPVFVFLAGVGAYLQKIRGKGVPELSRFLLTRGIWLIAVEVIVLHVLVWFNVDFSFNGPLQVIWAIGWSMVVLAALVYLPVRAIAIFGVAMIAVHNMLDVVHVTVWNGPGSPVPGAAAKFWMVLHQAGFTPLGSGPPPLVWVQYPLIPWIGVMAAGYAFGTMYELDRDQRILLVRRIGLSLIGAFVVIRAINVYGDPSPWSVAGADPSVGPYANIGPYLGTVLSFINTTKYPPSLLYLLMTLGPALVALSWFESRGAGGANEAGWVRTLVIFGRVPLFFYLWQWVLAHAAAITANIVAGRPFDYLFLAPPAIFNLPWGNGFRLWVVYVCWICIIAVEYPLCRWFAGVKQRRRDWWLGYL